MMFISDEEMDSLLTYRDAAEAIRSAFLSLGEGRASFQTRVRTEGAIGKLSTVGAILDDHGTAGAKVYTTSPSGRFRFIIVVFDPTDGRLLTAMDGEQLTRIRTAATSLIVARALADPDAKTLSLFGTGVQAGGHAHALAEAFPIETILLSHYRDATTFVDGLRTTLDLEVIQVDPAEAVRSADLVVTATRSSTPLFSAADVSPGTHITSVGATSPLSSEVDPRLIGRARVVVVESLEQARLEAGNLIAAVSTGSFSWDQAIELSDLLRCEDEYGHDPDRISFFDSLGIGLEDVAAASVAYLKRSTATPGAE